MRLLLLTIIDIIIMALAKSLNGPVNRSPVFGGSAAGHAGRVGVNRA